MPASISAVAGAAQRSMSHAHPVAGGQAIGLTCLPDLMPMQGAGSKYASDCIRVLPGYGIQTLNNVSSADQVPALPASATGGLPEASLCGIGFYSAGGYCLSCPYGAVSRNPGARAVEECGECCW
jgi:hypothetical protein